MPRKVQTAQRPFMMLVANLAHGSDPSRNTGGNPVKVRVGFTQQFFPDVNRDSADDRGPGVESARTPGVGTRMGHVKYTVVPVPVNATGTITVASNDFSVPASVYVGEFVLTSGVHYVVGGGVNATATALAVAIDGLPGFSAAAVAATVTVTGPAGSNGNAVLFEAVATGAVENFTLVPTTGRLAGGEPTFGPPLLIAP